MREYVQKFIARIGGHERNLSLPTRRNMARLRASEEHFRILADSSLHLIWVIDPEANIQFVNHAYREFFGISPEQQTGHDWHPFVHPDDLERCVAVVSEGLRDRKNFSVRVRLRRVDGAWRWGLSTAAPRFAQDGTFLGAVGSTFDVTDQVQAEQMLRDSDRRKDEFLATLAHELRNPLAPIRHAASILKSEHATPEQIRWGQEVITRQVRHMALLLDDLLDVSRITRGKLILRREPTGLTRVLSAAAESARPLIEERHHTLQIDPYPESLRLNADPVRLAQVFSNLLTNAAKYTDVGGYIRISVRQDGGTIVVRVKDNGVGIAPDALPRLFEMFCQVQSSADHSAGGLGIGLALSKGLVELHGGTIHGHSEGVGKGSIFTVCLPSGIAEQPQPVKPAKKPSFVAPARQRKVLVVDDNRDAADSLAMVIGLEGHDVKTAHDGYDALAIGASFHPDLILLDIGMPNLSGYEVARRIRKQNWGKDVELIAITGWGQREDRERAMAAGFDRHLTKPVDPTVVHDLVGSVRLH